MLGDTFRRFRDMRTSVRALVFLYWIYAFVSSMVGVFVQLFLYQRFTSLSLNILAAIISYTGVMLGFCVPGFLAALRRANIKHGFLLSFIAMGAAIFYLPRIANTAEAYSAMLFWGFGQGLFWLTVNTFELTETKDGERDFYSSALNAGKQTLSLLGPATATLLIWLSGTLLGLGTYTLLFTVAPLVFLLGFFAFASIRDYRPSPIAWADVRHYFTDRANQAAQIYTFGTGIRQTAGIVISPLVTLLILGTALHVGIYDTFFAIFSTFVILAVARYRTESNRLLIYGLTTAGLVLGTIALGYWLTFAALIVYTVVKGVLSPVNNVSSHVIALKAMEVGRKETDFYATMILRDFFLWIWRATGGLILLLIVQSFGASHTALSAGLYTLAAGLVLMYLGAFYLVKIVQRTAT
jgi:hypothetical protein